MNNYREIFPSKKHTISIMGFRLKPSSSLSKIHSLANFWEMLFSNFRYVSIQLDNSDLLIFIGLLHESNDKIIFDIESEIKNIKTYAFKSLPNDFDFEILEKGLLNSIITCNNKWTKNFAIVQLSLYSSFAVTLNGLLSIPNIKLVIAFEKNKNNQKYYFNFKISSNSANQLNQTEKRLVEYLKLNPLLDGKMETSIKLGKQRGRKFMGLNQFKLTKQVVMQVLESVDSYLQIVPNSNRRGPIYDWLGFMEVPRITAQKQTQEGNNNGNKISIKYSKSEFLRQIFQDIFPDINYYQIQPDFLSYKLGAIIVNLYFIDNKEEIPEEIQNGELLTSKNSLSFVLTNNRSLNIDTSLDIIQIDDLS